MYLKNNENNLGEGYILQENDFTCNIKGEMNWGYPVIWRNILKGLGIVLSLDDATSLQSFGVQTMDY